MYNPGGRLPYAVPIGVESLPPFEEYNMVPGREKEQLGGRGYRYQRAEDFLYPFAHGLSYTRFAFDDIAFEDARGTFGDTSPDNDREEEDQMPVVDACQSISVGVSVANTGALEGDVVVRDPRPSLVSLFGPRLVTSAL